MKATLAIRHALRPWVENASHRVLVGVSGGADSMALAIGTLAESKSAGLEVIAIIIDHQLQEGSAEVASKARWQLMECGFSTVEIVPVNVEVTDGMESSARRARYAAFDLAIARYQPDYFFLAHTKK